MRKDSNLLLANNSKHENSKQQLQAADSARRPDGHTDNIHEQRRHQHLPMLVGTGQGTCDSRR